MSYLFGADLEILYFKEAQYLYTCVSVCSCTVSVVQSFFITMQDNILTLMQKELLIW